MQKVTFSRAQRGLLQAFTAATSLIGLVPGAAYAQATSGVAAESKTDQGLPEIVVTAQRRSENIQRVPISITAISNEKLTSASITSSQQLPAVVPGLVMANNGQTLEPYLRGVGNNNNAPGNELPVAIYIDNVYIASANSTLLDLSDVANVAVLKGPQGTLFGRNAVAGVIQVTTKEPRAGDAFEGNVGLSFDNYRTFKADTFMSASLASDVAGSISATYSTQGRGWGKNINTGQDIRRIKHNVGLRSKLVVDAGPNTVIKLSADYADRSDNLAANFRGFNDGPVVFPGYTVPKNPWSNDSSFPSVITYKGGGASLTVDQTLGFAHLVSITAYRRDRLDYRFDPDSTPTNGFDIRFPSPTRQISQELQLNSTAKGWLKWSAGLYYFNNRSGVHAGIVQVIPASLVIGINDTQKARSYAAYGQATAELLADTRLTLGIRYTDEKRTFSGSQTTSIGGVIVADNSYPGTVKFSKITWRASLDHSFTQNILGYASFNRGFKSGGFNTLDPTNPPYLPETLDAYEIGLKTELFDRRARLNAALFWYDRSGIQVNRYLNGVQAIYNGAAARVRGIDVDFQTRLTSEFNLTGGFVWLDDKFTDFPNAILFSNDPNTGFPVQSQGSAKGARVPFSSRFSGNLALNYSKKTTNGTIDANFTVYHNSGYFTEPDNVLHQKAYQYLNARIGWTATGDRFSIALFARNLLDKAVATQLFTTTTWGRLADYTNPPRTFGIAVNTKF